MLRTKIVGDNFKMLSMVLTISVTNIQNLFTLVSVVNIQKMSPTLSRQHHCHCWKFSLISIVAKVPKIQMIWISYVLFHSIRTISHGPYGSFKNAILESEIMLWFTTCEPKLDLLPQTSIGDIDRGNKIIILMYWVELIIFRIEINRIVIVCDSTQ